MTTIEMEIGLMEHYDIRRNLIVPTVTSISGLVWFETDLLILSESGYATGIEIKVSKSDLKNDWNKWHLKNLQKKSSKENIGFFYKNIKKFYYAVPNDMKDFALQHIPDWCGLLTGEHGATGYTNKNVEKVFIKEVKKPLTINNTKWTESQRYKLARLGAIRILKYKKKFIKQNLKVEQ